MRLAAEQQQKQQQLPTAGDVDPDQTTCISKKRKLNEDSHWNFEVEYNDHFETPKIAYTDLLPVLQQAARDNKKSLAQVLF